ncbi:2-iminobutanoate/2-iminopropanoate deaminase [Arcicella aurantiaca]|uniref:2-iminobutanoate/2-iminopropanoate deaminase n=1 Tax=Arcicella aurantiaca TaxID=591202 RepID=A0A316ECG8_9BACT|nr:Rid family detoxifying hydrolase [Arcicella aurantiaca]PWK28171.1 2-iminobutanoate/2-iminopropanoate deaminase [Arcicella aurantiaca]
MKASFLSILFLFTSLEIIAQNKEIIKTDKAPVPIAPYSQGIKANGFLFVSGQIGLNPTTRKLVEGGVEAETAQIIENIKAILTAGGAKLEDILSTTIYLKNIDDFQKMNTIYGKYFTSNFPTRSTVAVSGLASGANIEITVTALLPPRRK